MKVGSESGYVHLYTVTKSFLWTLYKMNLKTQPDNHHTYDLLNAHTKIDRERIRAFNRRHNEILYKHS